MDSPFETVTVCRTQAGILTFEQRTCWMVSVSSGNLVISTSKITKYGFQLGSERWHYCAACEAVSPPRAWHCSGEVDGWWFLWVAPTYFLFPSCWHVNDVMDMIVQWWKIWVMECSACWNCSVIKDFLSLRSVRLKAGAPLHVCRLLRRPLQPQILRPLPRLALARGPLLHLPQLALCLDWWEL